MEKEQIIKALEVCANYQNFGDCDKCPAREGCENENSFLEKEALSLIREQEKRIEEIRCSSVDYREISYLLRDAQADTVRKMKDELKKTFSALCKGEMGDFYRIIDQIAKKLLEETT